LFLDGAASAQDQHLTHCQRREFLPKRGRHDQGNSFFVVHCHASEDFADILGGSSGFGLPLGPSGLT